MSAEQASATEPALLLVTDRDGEARSVEAPIGQSLMQILCDQGFDIEASCGGCAICATCHVYLGDAWAEIVQAPDVFESMQIEGLVYAQADSRLACQIIMTTDMADKSLRIAPLEL